VNEALIARLHNPAWLNPTKARTNLDLYERDAVAELRLPGWVRVARGPTEIAAALQERWASREDPDFLSVRDRPGGIQITLEARGLKATPDRLRERHLIHLSSERIRRHFVYPEKVPIDTGNVAQVAQDSPIPRSQKRIVKRESMVPGFSGSPLDRLLLDDGSSIVVKHIASRWSWVMRATDDNGREAKLWADGALQLPKEIDQAVIGVVHHPDRWLLYMDDVSRSLITFKGSFPAPGELPMLRHLRSLYSAGGSPPTGLCPLGNRLSLFSYRSARREEGGADLGPKLIQRGWELSADLVPSEVFDLSLDLADDPTPVAAALSETPCALLHGDLRPGNIAVADGRVILLDWGLACWAPPMLDVMWFLFNRTGALAEDQLRHALEYLFGPVDEAALELAVIAMFIQICPYYGTNAVQNPSEPQRANAKADLAHLVNLMQSALSNQSSKLGI
jgi:hypothetical protein